MKMAKMYEITKEQLEEIKAARKANQNKQADKRLHAVQLRGEGMKDEEIAEKLDTSSKVVSRWVCKYVKDGIDSLLPKKRVGNRRNMSSDEEKEFLSQYKDKAEKGQIVEVSEIKKAYDEKIGHTSGRGQIYRVLHRNGWRKVMPRSRHPKKADGEAIEASKKLSQKSPKYEVSTIQR